MANIFVCTVCYCRVILVFIIESKFTAACSDPCSADPNQLLCLTPQLFSSHIIWYAAWQKHIYNVMQLKVISHHPCRNVSVMS